MFQPLPFGKGGWVLCRAGDPCRNRPVPSGGIRPDGPTVQRGTGAGPGFGSTPVVDAMGRGCARRVSRYAVRVMALAASSSAARSASVWANETMAASKGEGAR